MLLDSEYILPNMMYYKKTPFILKLQIINQANLSVKGVFYFIFPCGR